MLLGLPVVLVVVLLFAMPTYMDPMFRDPFGIALLALGAVLVAAGYAATYLAVRLLHSGRPLWVFLLVLVCTVICTFPALWLVLLGPALLIFLHPSSG